MSVIVTYRRNYRRCFKRAPSHHVTQPAIGVQYMPYAHSVERWYAA